jgi:hypothetical protein
MAEMMMRPRSLNENTLMIPGKMWGYIVCEPCEAGTLPMPAPRRPSLWERLMRTLTRTPD